MSNGLYTQFGWITPPLPGLAPKTNNEEEKDGGGERSKIQQTVRVISSGGGGEVSTA